MKNILIKTTLISLLGIGGIFGGAVPVKAAEYSKSEIETKPTKMDEIQQELKLAQLQVGKINNKINDTQNKIKDKKMQITNMKIDIENLRGKMNDINKRIEAREGLLKVRVRSLQESGGNINYLDVLLGAKSFRDFINRTEAVIVFLEADRDILENHQKDKEQLTKVQSDLITKLSSLEALMADLKKMEEDLKAKKTDQTNLIESLKKEEKEVKMKVSVLENKKNERINNQVVTQIINEEPKNIVVTREKVAQSEENVQFIWPTVGGTITTYQGMRWGKFHKGIDIAGPADYAILAANGGTVKYAGWINGYGNTVRIQHSNGYLTQYAHLDSINVKMEQTVTTASKIGVMGSTGFSTGIHLDFEIYKNGKLLNPIDILPN
ncbi:murein hydrolase activator EnvC [Niallia sp. JL1B1071]|uniref:murein hydrolase activator EnvC family protein n=1 Tax=Niallia tiangongensis TaxID=3237105 RepID=UPI0037DD6E2F